MLPQRSSVSAAEAAARSGLETVELRGSRAGRLARWPPLLPVLAVQPSISQEQSRLTIVRARLIHSPLSPRAQRTGGERFPEPEPAFAACTVHVKRRRASSECRYCAGRQGQSIPRPGQRDDVSAAAHPFGPSTTAGRAPGSFVGPLQTRRSHQRACLLACPPEHRLDLHSRASSARTMLIAARSRMSWGVGLRGPTAPPSWFAIRASALSLAPSRVFGVIDLDHPPRRCGAAPAWSSPSSAGPSSLESGPPKPGPHAELLTVRLSSRCRAQVLDVSPTFRTGRYLVDEGVLVARRLVAYLISSPWGARELKVPLR